MKRSLGAVLGAAAVVLGVGGAGGAHEGSHAIVPIAAFGELAPTPLAPRENVEYVGGDNGFTGGHVAVESGRLYLGSYGNGMRIYDVADPSAPERVSPWARSTNRWVPKTWSKCQGLLTTHRTGHPNRSGIKKHRLCSCT